MRLENKSYRLWLDKCIQHQAAFVPFNEKYQGWATLGGGIITDEKKPKPTPNGSTTT